VLSGSRISSSVQSVKVYKELLADFQQARSRADRARAEWDQHLPHDGVRLTSHPELRAAHLEIEAAEAQESAAREALMTYRGE
jgi:hypothetical protein